LRVRTPEDLQARNSFETEVYEALQQEFGHLDGAVRAAARFEQQVYQDLRAQRLAEGYSHEDAGDLQEVFDRAWFSRCCTDLAVIKMTSRLALSFGLAAQHDQIVDLLVKRLFSPEPTRPGATKEVFLGSETAALSKQLRDRRAGST
jgi:hypothetical protein